MYHNVLSREVRSDDSIDSWTNHARFNGVASTISGFFTCDEFQAKNLPQEVIVDKLYRSILGREGQDDEKSNWHDRLARGDSIQMIINDCVESAEYGEKARAGTVPPPGMSVCSLAATLDDLTNHYRPISNWHAAGGIAHFIQTLYHNVLNRQSDDGIEDWTNHTRFNGIASTITGFFTSDEFQTKNLPHEAIVDKLFRSILGEKNIHLDRLRELGIQFMIKDFVGCDEYRQLAQVGAVPSPDMLVYSTKIIYLSMTSFQSFHRPIFKF